MRIVHIALSNFYLDNMGYQENELVRSHVEAGHHVEVLASTDVLGEDKRISQAKPGTYLGSDGAKVHRIAYRRLLPIRLAQKLRIHPGVRKYLETFQPDVIVFHGLCGWELLTVSKYARSNPEVIFHVDSHEDENNSARNWVSHHILHRLYYRGIIRAALAPDQKIMCVSTGIQEFVHRVYGLKRSQLEFFPLGGRVPTDGDYEARRNSQRSSLDLPTKSTIVMVQSGKMGTRKRLIENLLAFRSQSDLDAVLILAGSLNPDIADQAEAIIESDPRIRFEGWVNPEELMDLLCGADLYIQPGTQSATMQMSLCARCGVAIDDVPSHAPYVDGNGWLIGPATSLGDVYSALSNGAVDLPAFSARSHQIASDMLDYTMLAQRLTA